MKKKTWVPKVLFAKCPHGLPIYNISTREQDYDCSDCFPDGVPNPDRYRTRGAATKPYIRSL